MRRSDWFRSVLLALLAAIVCAPIAALAFVEFETGQVHPLTLSPDGNTLLALNTPDARLEVFRVEAGNLTHVGSVEVGLEPVAVAARDNRQAWVVNHLSDSVSIVDFATLPPRVVRTLLVGDEPRDVVFAGPKDNDGFFTRGFVTTARRGQNLPPTIDPALTTPGLSRALLYAFDTANLGDSLGGTPLSVMELFADSPRSLAATPDGRTVFAAAFQSGNRTTAVTEGAVCDGGETAGVCALDGVQMSGGLPNGQVPGGLPPPNRNIEGVEGPEVGLIVKQNSVSGVWEDELGRNWTNAVRFSLPDCDVFAIDASANPPREFGTIHGVGTILFNMVVNPTNGNIYVSNTDAQNHVRFEPQVRGHLHEARITVLGRNGTQPRHLNKHITALPEGYRTRPMPAEVKEASLSTPLDMALSDDGTLYVAAFGSSKVGVFKSSEIDADSFVPDASRQIEVSGGGPSGLAVDEAHGRLYVLTRFDNSIKVVDTTTRLEVASHPLFNPEPESIRRGRRFLYDARLSSSNGEASCASCHVFGDFDGLAWDLGNPDDIVRPNPNPLGPTGGSAPFHPLKGPMTTQTLRGMANQGPMHWRGDRTGATEIGDPRAYDSTLAFGEFNPAFDSLLGRDEGKIADDDMKAFSDFILQIMPPPNPIRRLDNQLTAVQSTGSAIFRDRNFIVDNAASCRGCHALDATRGYFGTPGTTTFEDESQEFKIPQLKNMYQKVGMFGTPRVEFAHILPEDAQFQGDQVRGFGFLHDGSIATIFDFLRARVFTINDDQRHALEEYLFAFDTTFAPIVGQQITLTATNAATAGPRIDLLEERAKSAYAVIDRTMTRECDLVARATVGGLSRGFWFDPTSGKFRVDRAAETPLSDAQLRALAGVPGQEMTFTCVPPGEGQRLGVDRDDDGFFDRDELESGTDPTDPLDPFRESPTPSPTATPTPPPPQCVGDCDDDGVVAVEEIVRSVNIATGRTSLDFCVSADRDFDEFVEMDELLDAVRDVLAGCR